MTASEGLQRESVINNSALLFRYCTLHGLINRMMSRLRLYNTKALEYYVENKAQLETRK